MLIHKSQRAQVDEEDEFYSQDLVGLTVLLNPYHAAAQPAVEDDSGLAAPSSSGHQIEAGADSPAVVDTKSMELKGQDANAPKNGDGSIGNVKVDAGVQYTFCVFGSLQLMMMWHYCMLAYPAISAWSTSA